MSAEKYYLFDQNNSGGDFITDDNLCHRMLIQAESQKQAEDFAFSMGIYYDGCSMGVDCGCCGDRWHEPEEITFPYDYGEDLEGKRHIFKTPEEYMQYLATRWGNWTKPEGRIFRKSGITEIHSRIQS